MAELSVNSDSAEKPMLDHDVERELEHMRAHLESVIKASDQRCQQAEDANREAIRVAAAANDKRFETLNEMRGALADAANRMVTRAESEAARTIIAEKLEHHREEFARKLETQVTPLIARVDNAVKPNWVLIAAFLSILFGAVTGMWIVIGLKIDTTLAPMALTLEQVRVGQATDSTHLRMLESNVASSTQADVVSRADREQLNIRMRQTESAIAMQQQESRTSAASTAVKLTEIETQFCASDIMRNLMHAYDMRLFAMIWHKINPGETIPTDNAYYPKICHAGDPGGGSSPKE